MVNRGSVCNVTLTRMHKPECKAAATLEGNSVLFLWGYRSSMQVKFIACAASEEMCVLGRL